MFINACNLAEGQDKTELDAWLAAETFDKQQKIKAVTAIYNKLGIDKMALKKIEHYFNVAKEYLAKVKVEDERKAEISRYAEELMHRKS